MTYYPQLVDLGGGPTWALIPQNGSPSFTVSMFFGGNPSTGTGYLVGDVGSTVTLDGGTFSSQASGVIAATALVGGNRRISLLNPVRYSGEYTVDPDISAQTGITGGSGTGTIVNYGRLMLPTIVSPFGAGFGATIGSMTGSLSFFGDCGGLIFELGSFSLNYANSIGLIAQGNKNSVPPGWNLTEIFDMRFGTSPSPAYRVTNLLFSFDTATQVFLLYLNDVFQASNVPSSFPSTDPVSNDPGSTAKFTAVPFTGSNFGLASLYLATGFTDLSIEANRRVFVDASGNIVDPSTYPSAPVNLYCAEGQPPSDIATNYGTGGAWSALLSNSAPLVFSKGFCVTYLFVNDYSFTIPENTVLTDTLDTGDCGTSRPGGSVTYSMDTGPTDGVAVLNADGSFTYTPDSDFVGFDSFIFLVTEVMPAGYLPPGYSQTATVFIEVTGEAPPPEIVSFSGTPFPPSLRVPRSAIPGDLIPLDPVPSQTVTVLLSDQSTRLEVYQKTTGLFIDVYVDDVLIIGGVIAEDRNSIVREHYLGFIGDLAFYDTQGEDDPTYTGLGERFLLIYQK